MPSTLTTLIAALAVSAAAAPQAVEQKRGLPIPITKRLGLVNADKTVNTEALKSDVASARAKVLSGLSNFLKNTGAAHPSALKGAQRRSTGADALTNDNNALWYGSVSVGTPAETFTVDFDTGSSNLFLPGPQCTSNCAGHTIYNPGVSDTAVTLGQTYSITFGDSSSVSADVYMDMVTVSGLTAFEQSLGVATEYSPTLAVNQFPADGLMGMAFQSISADNSSPYFQTLVEQGQVTDAVFSFKLAASESELYLGGTNSALYTGDFTYTPVTQTGFWQVTMDSIEANGQTIMSNIDSIIDTGTTLIIGDPSSVAELYNALGGTDASSTAGKGFYTFPCDAFPSISLTFGGTSFPISANTLNLGPVSTGSSDCVSGIVGQDTGSSFWAIGDVFLQNVYTTFDFGNTQVGFAQLA